MILALEILTVVHIACAATWFGHKLLLPRDLRDSFGKSVELAQAAVERMNRAEKIGIGSALGTLATGLAMIFTMGGFALMPVRIHIGLALAIAIFVVGGTLGRPAGIRIREAVAANDLESARSSARRLTMVFGIEQLLWTIILVLMVVKR